ncbi:ABC transporter permease [Oceanobacillus damuensis]|uniref:ABC transporter permease n=1 Tax=Oceanobacillus damuensis TaxID=937928 RepID=UPI000830A083|nr:ABC transporter permease [Oceanobacillus damuensis]
MKSIFQTRLTHWKKQWLSLLFWLSMPIAATLIIINVTNILQEDSKIPVGFVLKENTPMAEALLESVQASPLVRVYELNETQAKNMIESHELDSAFVIEEGYEQQIQRGNRNRLITSYKSDLSFAYTPISEMITSYVQQDSGKAKAAHTIINLAETMETSESLTFNEIITKAEEIQARENLLQTTFSFANSTGSADTEKSTIWNVWGLWAIFSTLSTLMFSDWIVKERNSDVAIRFAFTRFSFKSYLLRHLFVYSALLFTIDITAAILFHFLLGEALHLKSAAGIVLFRILCSTGAFLLALLFKNVYVFYSVSFAAVLFLAITSGAILPVEGLLSHYPLLIYINPLHPFLNKEVWNAWLVIFIILLVIWYFKGEKNKCCTYNR